VTSIFCPWHCGLSLRPSDFKVSITLPLSSQAFGLSLGVTSSASWILWPLGRDWTIPPAFLVSSQASVWTQCPEKAFLYRSVQILLFPFLWRTLTDISSSQHCHTDSTLITCDNWPMNWMPTPFSSLHCGKGLGQ
jgi:hypothetical protein